MGKQIYVCIYRYIWVSPLNLVVGKEPWDGGIRVPSGFLMGLGTFAFLRQKAAEVLWKHCSLDQDLQRRQITARLCNTQT